jgi:hypothetical protein
VTNPTSGRAHTRSPARLGANQNFVQARAMHRERGPWRCGPWSRPSSPMLAIEPDFRGGGMLTPICWFDGAASEWVPCPELIDATTGNISNKEFACALCSCSFWSWLPTG